MDIYEILGLGVPDATREPKVLKEQLFSSISWMFQI